MPKTSIVLTIAVLALLGAVSGADAALVISKSATSNVTCGSGVCTATAADAVLNIKDLKTLLQKADLKIVSGSAAQDIEIDVKFKWTKPFRLTLDAYRSIFFNQPITSEGSGGATLTTNDGGTGGQLVFNGTSHLTFWDLSSNLVLDGVSYTLVGDVKSLAQQIALNPSGSYALAKMYDASIDGTYANSPVTTSFDGNFTGLGHTLANLSIVYSQKVSSDFGLFQTLGADSFVRNLRLQNLNYSLQEKRYSGYVGFLAVNASGIISDVGVTGGQIYLSISPPHRHFLYGCIGGVVATNAGQISRVTVNGASFGTGVGSIGGVACNNNGTISESEVNATVGGGTGGWVGGLAAINAGTITLSSATGSIAVAPDQYGNDQYEGAGGIAGINYGSIDRAFSLASVDGGASATGESNTSYSFAGGVAAQNYGEITNSYAIGNLSSSDPRDVGVFVGGVIGAGLGGGGADTVSSAYAVNTFDCTECRFGPGGFDGDSGGTFASAYWDMDTSGIAIACGWGNTCTGITGLTDAQLKSGLPLGFDPAVWGQSPSINNGYPYLIANPPPK